MSIITLPVPLSPIKWLHQYIEGEDYCMYCGHDKSIINEEYRECHVHKLIKENEDALLEEKQNE